MKLVFGLIGLALLVAFLGSFVLKVKDAAMIAVTLVGVGMALVDLWQARNEADT
jgi:hypothetical protein